MKYLKSLVLKFGTRIGLLLVWLATLLKNLRKSFYKLKPCLSFNGTTQAYLDKISMQVRRYGDSNGLGFEDLTNQPAIDYRIRS